MIGYSVINKILLHGIVRVSITDRNYYYFCFKIILNCLFFIFFSQPIDQLESSGTEHDAMNDYFRLFLSNGQMNSLYSSGLSYEDFLAGSYFQCFDLTTSQEPGLRYAIPSVRVVKYTC